MSIQLFKRKPIESLLKEADESEKGLKRSLNAANVVALGIGAIIGAGLFVHTARAAADHAGPAVTFAFIVAALGCAFAGLCYAEFASMIPISGSAYTYSYATMGELTAWIIGWDLVLEYALGAATVAIAWSEYANLLLSKIGLTIPYEWCHSPFSTSPDGISGIINIPAIVILVILTYVLIKGAKESARLNMFIVILKVSLVILFIVLGWSYIKPENHTPYIPANTGSFGKFGLSGILSAAGVVFFAFIGFDAVSTAAQETKNPKRDMPIGILLSLGICTILYVLFGHVITGIAHYTEFQTGGPGREASVAYAIKQHLPYSWLDTVVTIAIIAGFSSVILVMLMGQSRVFYSMSKDGLVPPAFSELHPTHKTPYKANLIFLVFVGLFAAFVPGDIVGDMTSIGTLFAFTLVCIGVIIMRKTNPNLPRPFRTPLVPLIPILGIIVCSTMIYGLNWENWLRLLAWLIIGFVIYFGYSIRHSKLHKESGGDTK